MKPEKLIYYPLFPNVADLGTERSDYVRKWIEESLFKKGIVTDDESKANAYLVATGDGGMTKAARSKCDSGKYLFGINCGTLGFLMNQLDSPKLIPLYTNEIHCVEVKLMQGTFFQKNGDIIKYLAFNDIFCGGNIADYLSFEIKGSLTHFRDRKVKGNGVFISTPQGTTGFALNARGSSAVLPLDTATWYIGGVATGPYPDSVFSPQEVEIVVKSRKKVLGYADGYDQEAVDIEKILVQPTDHKVKLAFVGDIDFESRRRELAQRTELGTHWF
jgi:NAD+ kinase